MAGLQHLVDVPKDFRLDTPAFEYRGHAFFRLRHLAMLLFDLMRTCELETGTLPTKEPGFQPRDRPGKDFPPVGSPRQNQRTLDASNRFFRQFPRLVGAA